MTIRSTKLRSISLLLGALAVILPIAWFVYQQWEFNQWAAKQEGPVCGLPALVAYIGAGFIAVIFSFISVLLGTVAYFRMPKPRPNRRIAELLLLAVPFVLGSLIVFMP